MTMKINPINVRLRIRLSSCSHARAAEKFEKRKISSVPRPFTVSRFHCTASLTVPWDGCTEHETHTAHTKIPNDLRRKWAERCQHARCRREASQVLAASLVGLHPGTQVSHNAGKCTGKHTLVVFVDQPGPRTRPDERAIEFNSNAHTQNTHSRTQPTHVRTPHHSSSDWGNWFVSSVRMPACLPGGALAHTCELMCTHQRTCERRHMCHSRSI